MQPLKKRANVLFDKIKSAFERLEIEKNKEELEKLEKELADSNIWVDVKKAQKLSKKAAKLQTKIEPWEILYSQAKDIIELLELGDESMTREFDGQISALEKQYEKENTNLLFNGEFDENNAIIKLSSGAGGTDAQDWTEMLERMYLRFAEKNDIKVQLLERSKGEEAGIKSAAYNFSGVNVYGKMKSEAGVHRLVRISPFNSDNLRQTSFALVEVFPEIDDEETVKINEKDLRIDVYRSGGHGGQSVNTTDSAVRITHIPTGTTVAIQNERSQIQNKETAMKILASKLLQMKIDQKVESIEKLRAGSSADFGSQIRNYVLHPYTLVKDVRTKHETSNTQAVLDGEINDFILAFLEQNQIAKKS